ncbi:3044_t:CDS:2, partial [Acaulospora colombiana]
REGKQTRWGAGCCAEGSAGQAPLSKAAGREDERKKWDKGESWESVRLPGGIRYSWASSFWRRRGFDIVMERVKRPNKYDNEDEEGKQAYWRTGNSQGLPPKGGRGCRDSQFRGTFFSTFISTDQLTDTYGRLSPTTRGMALASEPKVASCPRNTVSPNPNGFTFLNVIFKFLEVDVQQVRSNAGPHWDYAEPLLGRANGWLAHALHHASSRLLANGSVMGQACRSKHFIRLAIRILMKHQ